MRAKFEPMAKRVCSPTSGSIGAETYLVGKNGQVVRNRIKPRNPRTVAQVNARLNLGSQSSRWRTLTDAQRLAWNGAAAAVSSKERLGMSGKLSGQQLFCKLNATLETFGEDTVDLPTSQPTFGALAVTGLEITNVAGVISVTLDVPSNPGQNTVLRASECISAGIQRSPRLAILGTCPAPVAAVTDITTLYVTKYGDLVVGKRIFVAANQTQDGWESPLKVWTAIVPAA